jgi:hypothetical protein
MASLEAGTKGGGREDFERCASVFIELYNEFESSDRADSLLFNAAHCSESAGMIGQAVQLRIALLERHPQSDLAESTLWTLAEGYTAITHYEHAAERYEQYAAQYPEAKETPGALHNAYLFRVGLSQNAAALRDLDEYQRLYERKDPDKAALIFWARQSLLETEVQRRDHALAYLEGPGKAGPIDRVLVAEAVIAQFDWRRSCTEPLLFDSCITIERTGKRTWVPGVSAREQAEVDRVRAEQAGKSGKRAERCGGSGYAVVNVHARKQTLARVARDRFAQILTMIRRADPLEIPAHEVDRQSDLADAWAMALVYQADAAYEEALRLELPDNLDFFVDLDLQDSTDPATARRYKAQLQRKLDSYERLSSFLSRAQDFGKELASRYAEVERTRSPHWQLLAATRMGLLYESFADQLAHAKIPRALRSEPQVEAYCDALVDASLQSRDAIEVWAKCIYVSRQFQFFNELSRLCEARLSDLDPRRHPATNELFGESVYAPTRLRTVGVQPESGVPEAPSL